PAPPLPTGCPAAGGPATGGAGGSGGCAACAPVRRLASHTSAMLSAVANIALRRTVPAPCLAAVPVARIRRPAAAVVPRAMAVVAAALPFAAPPMDTAFPLSAPPADDVPPLSAPPTSLSVPAVDMRPRGTRRFIPIVLPRARPVGVVIRSHQDALR